MIKAVYTILFIIIVISTVPNSLAETMDPSLSFTKISTIGLDKTLYFSGERFGESIDVIVTVSDPNEKTIQSMELRTTKDGAINILVSIDKNYIEGQYQIIVYNNILALTYDFSYQDNKVSFVSSSIDYFDINTIEETTLDISDSNETIQLDNTSQVFTLEFSENESNEINNLDESYQNSLENQIELLQIKFTELQNELIGSFVSVEKHEDDITEIHHMIEDIQQNLSEKNGVSCWDTNSDGIPNLNEDKNGDGKINAIDCQGIQGPSGQNGISCWDIDGDGIRDAGEDLNGDSIVDIMDCKGLQGDSGIGLSCENQKIIKDVINDFKLSDDCIVQKLVINEIVYDTPGSDLPEAFTELHGTPGLDLNGYQLVAIDLNKNREYRSETLSGIIPSDGYFVIGTKWAKGDVLANRDYVGQVNWKNGPSVIILKDPSGEIIDALQYGDFSIILGEGIPAKVVEKNSGHSLTRDSLHTDSNVNFLDFKESQNPTPGF